MEHSKWEIVQVSISTYQIWTKPKPNRKEIMIAGNLTEDVAKRIVLCCNSHDGLVEALKKYGDHLGTCYTNLKMGKCNCGFDEALAAATTPS